MDLSELTQDEMVFLNTAGMAIFNIISNYLKSPTPILNEQLSIRDIKNFTNVHVMALFNDIKVK